MTALTVLVSAWLAGAAPITLDEALAAASRRNPDVAVARADEEAAAADVRLSYQGVLPRLDLTGAFGHQFQGEQQQVNVVPNPTPPPDFVREAVTYPKNDFGVYQLGLGLTWTVFDGLASWNGISAARTRSAAARRQLDETTLRTAFEVTRRFYEVVKQQRALDVRRQTAALSAELVERADALFSAGRGTKADTYSARVNLGNDRIAVRTQAAALERARTDLASVIGLGSGAGLEVVPPDTVTGPRLPAQPATPPVDALLAEARRRRPGLASRRLAGEAGDLEIARAKGAYWPVVGLQASYDKATPDLTGDFGLLGNPSRQYVFTAQVTLTWNLYAGGSTRAGVQRAEADAHRAWALVDQAEQTVAAEVSVAREQLASLLDTAPTVQENLEAAQGALRFARERLDAGVGSQLEVRDAMLKLADARLAWVSTVVDLVVARADLNRAVGGGL
ncbi:TolC family protein [Anaeromyxobacter oryzae]|uniref:Membrane protein n=1 Tax=Anaeromyxobacter oryzae TaxID=2918170 RepID=A0ABM7X0E2_9BACT|nr:TolC family protein [Anaeromyxobacter oryzae]BDG05192.1 membrane protein [Anaeromyxobacter oryzae]